ncbi:helix-turn-helix domain-containing protein (plasmid) [Vagococcus sp. JNUCC 83]
MNISEEIKNQRLKNNLTQEQLSEILNVSRSTVSSWEVGRNYPDLETIVAISDLFNISLDELLRGDKKMIKQITDDTKLRKVQTKKIQLLSVGLTFIIIVLIILGYKSIYNQEIVNANQIDSIKMTDKGEVLIKTNLPFYRSIDEIAMAENVKNSNTMDIRIGSKFDWTLKNDEVVEVHPYTFPNLKQINIVNKYGEIIKTFLIK